MKKIILLLLLICIGLSSFAQICKSARKTPFFKPNRIDILFVRIDSIFNTIQNAEFYPTFSVKVLIKGKKQKIITWEDGQSVTYQGKIADTMKFVFKAPDFEKDTFTYYKNIHYDPYNTINFFYITPKGKNVNKIVILGDEVDVHVNGEKYSYSAQELGRENNDAKGNAQMLLKIPELTVKDYIIYIKNQPITILFIDGGYRLIDGEIPTGKSPSSELLRELQNLAHKEILE